MSPSDRPGAGLIDALYDAIADTTGPEVTVTRAVAMWAHDEAGRAQQIDTLRETLHVARMELDRWGRGDMHYGNTPRDPKVLAMLTKIDEVLDATL